MNGVSRAQGEAGVPESLGQPQLLEGRAGDSRNPTRNSLRSPAARHRRDVRASTLAVGIDVCARAVAAGLLESAGFWVPSSRDCFLIQPPRARTAPSACSSTSSVARACLSGG
jgi:hypothetical protein